MPRAIHYQNQNKGHSARIPAKLKHFASKDSRKNSILEQILIAKVFNFDGICSMPEAVFIVNYKLLTIYKLSVSLGAPA